MGISLGGRNPLHVCAGDYLRSQSNPMVSGFEWNLSWLLMQVPDTAQLECCSVSVETELVMPARVTRGNKGMSLDDGGRSVVGRYAGVSKRPYNSFQSKRGVLLGNQSR